MRLIFGIYSDFLEENWKKQYKVSKQAKPTTTQLIKARTSKQSPNLLSSLQKFAKANRYQFWN